MEPDADLSNQIQLLHAPHPAVFKQKDATGAHLPLECIILRIFDAKCRINIPQIQRPYIFLPQSQQLVFSCPIFGPDAEFFIN